MWSDDSWYHKKGPPNSEPVEEQQLFCCFGLSKAPPRPAAAAVAGYGLPDGHFLGQQLRDQSEKCANFPDAQATNIRTFFFKTAKRKGSGDGHWIYCKSAYECSFHTPPTQAPRPQKFMALSFNEIACHIFFSISRARNFISIFLPYLIFRCL